MGQDHSIIDLFAGERPDGQAVYEKIVVRGQPPGELVLMHSPAFVPGLARGDRIRLTDSGYELVARGGNVSVRVYSRGDVSALEQLLTRAVEQLGGQRDIRADQVLVYSLPASAGFTAIEGVFDGQLGGRSDVQWRYGNVYDPASGEPLGWWAAPADDIDNP